MEVMIEGYFLLLLKQYPQDMFMSRYIWVKVIPMSSRKIDTLCFDAQIITAKKIIWTYETA